MTREELERKGEEYFCNLDRNLFPLGGCSSRYRMLIAKAYADGMSTYARWIDDNVLKMPYDKLREELKETGGIKKE